VPIISGIYSGPMVADGLVAPLREPIKDEMAAAGFYYRWQGDPARPWVGDDLHELGGASADWSMS